MICLFYLSNRGYGMRKKKEKEALFYAPICDPSPPQPKKEKETCVCMASSTGYQNVRPNPRLSEERKNEKEKRKRKGRETQREPQICHIPPVPNKCPPNAKKKKDP